MSIVATLDVPLRGETGNLDKALAKGAAGIQSFTLTVNGSLPKVDAAMKDTEKKSVTMAAAIGGAAGAAVTALIGLVKKGYEFSKATMPGIAAQSKFADQLGVTTRAIGGLELASGMEIEETVGSLVKFQKHVAEAAAGAGETAAAFNRLGISAAAIKDLSLDQQLDIVADAFMRTGNAADKTRLTLELFGKGGIEMKKLLMKGSEGMEQFRKDAEAMGISVSGEQAAAVRASRKEWKIWEASLVGMGRSVAVAMTPFFTAVNTFFSGAGKAMAGFVKENIPLFQAFTDTIFDVGRAIFGMNMTFNPVVISLRSLGTLLGLNSGTWEEWKTKLLTGLFTVQYYAINWKDALSLAFDKVQLAIIALPRKAEEKFFEFALAGVTAFADFLSWVGLSAANVNTLVKIAALAAFSIAQPFILLAKVMGGAYAVMSAQLQAMLGGMKATSKEAADLKDELGAPVKEREKTEVEKWLAERIKKAGEKGKIELDLEARIKDKEGKFGADLDAFLAEKFAALKKKPKPDEPPPPGEPLMAGAFAKAGALERGSKEAFSAIFGGQSDQARALALQKQQVAEQQAARKLAEKLLDEIRRAPLLARARL